MIMPEVKIGKGVVVDASAVATKDISDYAVVAGNSGRIENTEINNLRDNMIVDKKSLEEYLSADKKALGRKGKNPRFNDLIWKYEILLRKCEYYNNVNTLFGRFFSLYYRYRRHVLGVKLGYSIPINVCGKGLCLPHIGTVVISNYARIGDFCKIHVGVNIGADARIDDAAPKIGNYVYIGPGAKLFGAIEIADYVAIGANSVVNKSFKEKKHFYRGNTC